jgi:signal transduction histidine kinase
MPNSRRFSPERWREAAEWHERYGYGPGWNRVSSWEPRTRSPQWTRVWVPVIISLIVQVPGTLASYDRTTHLIAARATGLELLLLALLALVGPVALIFARRFPGPVVAIVAVAASADLLLAGERDGPPYIALAFAIGSAIIRGARVWAWSAIAGAWILTLIVALAVGLAWQPWRVVGITIGILLLVGMAESIRTRRERLSNFQQTIARRRQSEVQAERVRIARELHDVLAHSLSQINVQAGVGLHLMDKQPQKAAEALASIKDTSKTALDEVRSVLGVLRAEDPNAPLVPEPDLARLEGLVASITAQGVDVTLSNSLESVPKATQLALYRIVQESLTNVLRHANASKATVRLTEADGEFSVTVSDNGTGPTEKHSDGGGRGLLGMRERAELLGGTLDASRGPKGFTVTARIPKKETE